MKVLKVLGLVFLLTACSTKPSLEEVETSIKEGLISAEDALEKGYVTQEWYDEYISNNVIEAPSKLGSKLGEFELDTLNGNKVSDKDLEKITYFAYLDPSDDKFIDNLQKIEKQVSGKLNNLIVLSSEYDGDLSSYDLNIVVENEQLVRALGDFYSMFEGRAFMCNYVIERSFASSYSSVVSDTIYETAISLEEMFG